VARWLTGWRAFRVSKEIPMVETIIWLLVYVMLFCGVAYGLKWICTQFGLPTPVLWICGVILLIVLLLFIAGQFGGGPFPSVIPRR
jgi:hypothetical protein